MTRLALLAAALVLVVQPALSQGRPRHGGEGVFRRTGPGPMQPLLRKVFEMAGSVKLAGTRVVQHLDGGERKLVTERVYRDGLKVHTEVLDGPNKGEIAVEDRFSRKVWNPKANEIRESMPREGEALMRLGRMLGGRPGTSTVQEVPGGQIVGVETRQLQLAMTNGTIIARAWIDPVHGVVLKLQTFDPKGQLNGSVEYTSAKFNPAFPAGAFTINKPGARIVTPLDELGRASRELGFLPFHLPNDWKLVSARKMEPKGVKVLMQTYTKSGARVSLFQIKGEVNADKLSRLGGREARSYVWDRDGYKLVLIGPMSQEDLRRIADRVSN